VRILHVIPSAAPVDGGPNVAVRAMARGLARRGIDVTVATTNAAGAKSLDVPLDTPVIDDGVAFRYFARSIPGSWKFSWPMTRWLWANARAYDVVHVHALFSYATIPGCRAAARAPVPYVLRPLGTLSDWSLGRRRWKKRPYYALLERSHLEMASAIHVTSDAEAEEVARLGYGDRARVIPLGVDVAERPPRRTKSNALEGGAALRMLFLSRLHEKKNIPLLLHAVARATNASCRIELTIAGSGDAGYRGELVALAEQLGLRDRVSFVGHVEGAAKEGAFAQTDCFILPSAHENFGLAVAEALAAGLPAIVTPGVALSRDVATAGAGLVTEATATALAAAITWAAEHPAALLEMGDRAWQLARRSLSWETTCAHLAWLYDELAAGRHHEGRRA
jgi:glycosyltransferase involved in cell wall biosynthesis